MSLTKNSYLMLMMALFTWVSTLVASHQLKFNIRQQRFLAPPPEHIEKFTLGFNDIMADSLWIRWIQDMDVCETFKGVKAEPKPANQFPEFLSPTYKECNGSWSFKMLDAITRLAPKDNMPYRVGGITLSVMIEDYAGAKIIFDRGIAAFPNDWELLYRAAYHYMYDRNDLEKASELLSRAANNGGPGWLSMLAARAASKVGRYELGIHALTSYLETVKDDEKMKTELEKRIADLRKKQAAETDSQRP